MEFRFKQENRDVNARRQNCEKIRQQFPDKIPIICEKDPKSNIRDIDKTKYLVPNDLTVSQFSFMIRKRIEIKQEEAFFLLVNGKRHLLEIQIYLIFMTNMPIKKTDFFILLMPVNSLGDKFSIFLIGYRIELNK